MGPYLKCAGILCVAFGCYLNTIFGSFVFDDTEAIVKNRDVLSSTPVSELFKNDFWGTSMSLNKSHKSYRPVTVLTYRLNVFLAGGQINAVQFHITNVFLYGILCVLTVPIFTMCLKQRAKQAHNLAYYSSLLFTVHPIHTEVVAALVGRADILSSILFLVSILMYRRALKNHSNSLFIATVLIIWIAVLCKETAITALGVCVVYDLLHSRALRDGFSWLNHKRVIIRGIVLCISGLMMLYFRLWVMDFEGPTFTSIDNPAAYSDDLFSRVFTYNYIYFLNVLLLLWPQWLCFDWSMGCIPLIEDLSDFRIIFVMIFWISGLTVVCKMLRSIMHLKICEPTILALAMIVLPFLPACNLFLKVGFVIAERILLLPSLGICLLVVLGYKKLETVFRSNRKLKQLFKPFQQVSFVCILLLYAVFFIRTIHRNLDWLTEKNLFVSALAVCPLNAKVHYNVGKVAADEQKTLLAELEYRRALELNPNYEQAMNNLANLLREENQFVEAEILLRNAIAVRPNFAAAWMNLGIVLTSLNKPEEAEKCYLEAISHRRKYPDCFYNLGNLYLDLHRNDDALWAWEMAVSYKPTHTAAWSNTLVLLDSLKNYEKVLKLGRNALMHNPRSPALHFCLANTLGKILQFEKAEKHFLEALHLNPNNALYFSNLGVLYHRWNKLGKAREMYQKALQLDPTLKTTEKNLRKLS